MRQQLLQNVKFAEANIELIETISRSLVMARPSDQ
jgi:hypothetical protein